MVSFRDGKTLGKLKNLCKWTLYSCWSVFNYTDEI